MCAREERDRAKERERERERERESEREREIKIALNKDIDMCEDLRRWKMYLIKNPTSQEDNTKVCKGNVNACDTVK